MLLWLALWLTGFQVRGAIPPAGSAGRGSIQGVVIRAGASGTGLPGGLPDVRVALTPQPNTNSQFITRPDGSFTFLNVPAGRYNLTISRDGFVPLEDRSLGITPTGLRVTVAAGQTLKDIVLPMIPAPVLFGKVVGPDGTPLAAALVRAYVRQFTPYGPQLKIVRKGMTDDLGEFRLAGLNFGTYFVSGGYSDRDRAMARGKTMLSANVSAADDGYTTMFYENGEDILHAQAVRLAPGTDPGTLNIYLTNSNRFKIRGQVLPASTSAQLMLASSGSDLTDAAVAATTDTNGSFEIGNLSPGSYLLFADAGGGMLSEIIAINITDHDVDGVRLVTQATLEIAGTLSLEGNPRLNLSGLRVRLARSGVEFDQRIAARAAADGSFTLARVVPIAQYDVVVEGLPRGVYVKSITTAGRDILAGKSPLVPNQILKIVLATATDELEVRVTGGGVPAAGTQVVLVPAGPLRRRVDRYITGFTDETGDLRLTAVPPGDYTTYAFEQIDAGAYYAFAYNASADITFKDRAVNVTVGAHGVSSIELRRIPAAETVTMGSYE